MSSATAIGSAATAAAIDREALAGDTAVGGAAVEAGAGPMLAEADKQQWSERLMELVQPGDTAALDAMADAATASGSPLAMPLRLVAEASALRNMLIGGAGGLLDVADGLVGTAESGAMLFGRVTANTFWEMPLVSQLAPNLSRAARADDAALGKALYAALGKAANALATGSNGIRQAWQHSTTHSLIERGHPDVAAGRGATLVLLGGSQLLQDALKALADMPGGWGGPSGGAALALAEMPTAAVDYAKLSKALPQGMSVPGTTVPMAMASADPPPPSEQPGNLPSAGGPQPVARAYAEMLAARLLRPDHELMLHALKTRAQIERRTGVDLVGEENEPVSGWLESALQEGGTAAADRLAKQIRLAVATGDLPGSGTLAGKILSDSPQLSGWMHVAVNAERELQQEALEQLFYDPQFADKAFEPLRDRLIEALSQGGQASSGRLDQKWLPRMPSLAGQQKDLPDYAAIADRHPRAAKLLNAFAARDDVEIDVRSSTWNSGTQPTPDAVLQRTVDEAGHPQYKLTLNLPEIDARFHKPPGAQGHFGDAEGGSPFDSQHGRLTGMVTHTIKAFAEMPEFGCTIPSHSQLGELRAHAAAYMVDFGKLPDKRWLDRAVYEIRYGEQSRELDAMGIEVSELQQLALDEAERIVMQAGVELDGKAVQGRELLDMVPDDRISLRYFAAPRVQFKPDAPIRFAGQTIDRAAVTALLSPPDGSTIVVIRQPDGAIRFEVGNAELGVKYSATIHHDIATNLMTLEGLFRDGQTPGIGPRILDGIVNRLVGDQLDAAPNALPIDWLVASPKSGAKGGSDSIVRYIQHGFDGRLPNAILESLPDSLRGNASWGRLAFSEEGRQWIAKHVFACSFQFDLDLDSPSHTRLALELRELGPGFR